MTKSEQPLGEGGWGALQGLPPRKTTGGPGTRPPRKNLEIVTLEIAPWKKKK